MEARDFHIFSGSADNDPVWLETIEGIVAAINRMKERGRNLPGRYFVYNVEDGVVLAAIDTTKAEGHEGKSPE